MSNEPKKCECWARVFYLKMKMKWGKIRLTECKYHPYRNMRLTWNALKQMRP